MPELRLRGNTRHFLWVAIGLLCCLLIALAAIVQGTHAHSFAHPDDPGCAICYTAHVSAQPPAILTLPLLVRWVAPLAASPRLVCYHRLHTFSLSIRPPPARTALI